ncbi:unnamed protein product [Linum trigynum]|uniref:Uncharacterized protein n=1 Tax=Linum trigynum TaxID=586398 RepID=A0AAV2D4V5_9ROSI
MGGIGSLRRSNLGSHQGIVGGDERERNGRILYTFLSHLGLLQSRWTQCAPPPIYHWSLVEFSKAEVSEREISAVMMKIACEAKLGQPPVKLRRLIRARGRESRKK